MTMTPLVYLMTMPSYGGLSPRPHQPQNCFLSNEQWLNQQLMRSKKKQVDEKQLSIAYFPLPQTYSPRPPLPSSNWLINKLVSKL